MLNRVALMQAIEGMQNALFVDTSKAQEVARHAWESLSVDRFFEVKVRHAVTAWSLPSWDGFLGAVIPVPKVCKQYTIASVDGSQIYPDRHQGTSCFLINIGSIIVRYGAMCHQPVIFNSQPYVFSDHGQAPYAQVQIQELINCRRQELELHAGYAIMQSVLSDAVSEPHLLLFDGSLVFWHLEAKDTALRDLFLHKYLASLQQLHDARILNAGYISVPKSRELMNLVKLFLCDFDVTKTELYKEVEPIVDAQVASWFLTPGTRSLVFRNNAHINAYYPDSLRPHFFYLHVGSEIGRVEIPAWIACDEQLVNQVAALVLDQVNKGNGYPVVLAEAHEQAVVKGPDREFFYHLLHKVALEHQTRHLLSPKVLKKRRIGV